METYEWSSPEAIRGLSREEYGTKLASRVADALDQGKALSFIHRDYCGHSLLLARPGTYSLCETEDGQWHTDLMIWDNRETFVAFLAAQSDYTMSGADSSLRALFTSDLFRLNNQRITRLRLMDFISG